MSNQPAPPQFPHTGTVGNLTSGPNSVAIRTRPAGVTATGVLSIIAGLMGGFSGLSMIVSLLFSSAFAQLGAAQAKGMSSEQVTAMEEMNAATQAIASKYMLFNGGMTVLTCFISLALLIGGIGLLRSRPSAGRLLRRTFVAAIVNELLSGVLYVMTQLEMAPVMAKYMSSMGGSGGNSGAGEGVETVARLMIYFGLALWLAWAVTKIVLFAIGRRYLNRSTVVEYLENSASSPSAL